jgi:IclR family acetate operon transcriptional repressor
MTTTQPIQSLDRGLILLEAVARAGRPVTLSELMAVLKIDRSSVFRLANTLKRRGYLAQMPESKRYALGSSIWRLAALFHFENLLLQVARPHIFALAETTGETTHVAVREGMQAVLIDRQLTAQTVGVAGAGSGTGLPLHSSGLGKALLADFDREGLVRLLGAAPLARFTRRTITTLEELATACAQTRERGYAVDDEEGFNGVKCLGAPVRDASGAVVAAVGVSAPGERLPRAAIRKVAVRVVEAAAAISRELGHGLQNEGDTDERSE